MTQKDPGRTFYHNDGRIKTAGGVVADSARGTRRAHAKGYKWIDQDFQLSHATHAGVKKGPHDTSFVWVNAHGKPFFPAFMRASDKFEYHAWMSLKVKHPGLRNSAKTFRQNAKRGINVEAEIKDIRPLATKKVLKIAFAKLAKDAESAYGTDWAKHVEVKVLTNLGGGLKYALRIAKFAKKAGFTTYLLNHEGIEIKIPKKYEPYVDFVRGDGFQIV